MEQIKQIHQVLNKYRSWGNKTKL